MREIDNAGAKTGVRGACTKGSAPMRKQGYVGFLGGSKWLRTDEVEQNLAGNIIIELVCYGSTQTMLPPKVGITKTILKHGNPTRSHAPLLRATLLRCTASCSLSRHNRPFRNRFYMPL